MTASRNLALVVGADRPFGAEIVRRLRAEGFEVALAEADAERPLDVLVVNCTVEPAAVRFRDLTDDGFRSVLDAQLYEFVAAGQVAARRMSSGGAIVRVGSNAHLGSWEGVHQAAGEAACVAMARSMALELGPLGIRVNTLATDPVTQGSYSAGAKDEVAATVAWLAGPDSGLVSGETILLNRGRSLQMAQAAKR